MQWIINDEEFIEHSATDELGSEEGSIAIAHLVNTTLDDSSRGSRVSVLVVTPDPSFTGFINITCDAAVDNGRCTITAEVIAIGGQK